MSLYDGIELNADKTEKTAVGWSSGFKLLKSQIQLRKASLTQVKREQRSTKVPSVSLAPAVDLSSKSKAEDADAKGGQSPALLGPTSILSLTMSQSDNNESPLASMHQPAAPPAPAPAPAPTVASTGKGNVLFGEIEVIDEYNPLFPNDYEKLARKKEEERQRQKEEDRKREAEERELKRKERLAHDMADEFPDDDPEPDRSRLAGAAIAPPTALIEQDKKVLDEPMPPPPKKADFGGASKGLNVAARIMEKYGYRSGAGLGKQEQGMSTALQVEKVSKRGGKIIHEKDKDGGVESITEILKNPTKVVLLRNMVGPGEVDPELEGETKEECTKYGEVIKCIIFEIPEADDDESVRIFLEFGKMEQAIKAVVDLNGRFFGGRQVKAGFFNLDKFRRNELSS